MTPNDWLMKRDALLAARKCSKLIEQRLGLRLALAHPAFISLLGDYAALYDCDEIRSAYIELIELAPESQARLMRAKLFATEAERRQVSPRRVSTLIKPEQIEA